MKIYKPKDIQKLFDFKESIENEELKENIEQFISNYNWLYVKCRELIEKRDEQIGNMDKIEKLDCENKDLKEKNERLTRIIKTLKGGNKRYDK